MPRSGAFLQIRNYWAGACCYNINAPLGQIEASQNDEPSSVELCFLSSSHLHDEGKLMRGC